MTEIFIPVITFLSVIYFITLLILRSAAKKLAQTADNTGNPTLSKVSVIVCARNEQHNLADLIKCLEEQKIDGLEVEYILVNDRSEDKTPQIIDAIANENNLFKTIHISDRVSGFGPKKRAIDTAIKIAKGDVILLTDADGRPGNKWVKSMISLFSDDIDMVIGYAPYQVKRSHGIFKKMLALEYFSIASIAMATVAVGLPLTCVGTNMAYRKQVYLDIDGFGEYKAFISGDDDLFLTRVREAGKYKISYAANAECHVYNNPPQSWYQFINQRLRYASKGFDYPLHVVLILSAYVIFNTSLLAGFIAGLMGNVPVLSVTVLSFLFKTLVEILFLKRAANIINDNRFIHYYFPASLLHLPYILFFGIFGQFKFFKWAEKTAERGISKTVGS